jgi:hypothetical protein
VSVAAGPVFAFAFVFVALVFAEELVLRLSLRTFALRLLLLLFAPRLAKAMSITTTPPPMIKTATSPPKIHQMAFDFFRGAGGGGDQCG